MSLKTDMIRTASVDVGSVAANTTAVITFILPDVKVTDFVAASKPSHTAGLGLVNCRVSAANTIEMTFLNATTDAIDPAAETYRFLVVSV